MINVLRSIRVFANMFVSIDKVALRRAWLILGWVTDCTQLNSPGK